MKNAQRIRAAIDCLIVSYHPIPLSAIHFAAVALDDHVTVTELSDDCVRWTFTDGSQFETDLIDEDRSIDIELLRKVEVAK